MLIRLLPAPSQPTVLFKLSFENFSDSLQIPAAWANQLSALALDDLEVPNLLHAFDKAVGLQSILEEVVFDLVKGKVRCLFIDGDIEEWSIDIGSSSERGCDCGGEKISGVLGCGTCRRFATLTERLESVLDDVNESAKEAEREKQLDEAERQREEEDEAERDHEQIKTEGHSMLSDKTLSLNSPPGSVKGSLKKHRSLLMNLVASLLPSSNVPEIVQRRSRSQKRSASLPNTRSPSPSSEHSVDPAAADTLGESSPAEDTPSTSSWSSSWSSLTRSVSNPISRKASWGRRNRYGHKFKSKSVSGSLMHNAESTPEGDEADNTIPLVSSPTSISSPNERRLRPLKLRPVSMCSLPALPVSSASEDDTPIIIAPPPLPRLSARALRRRARSTLVDTFRLCVLPELGRRVRDTPSIPPTRRPSSLLVESPGWRSTITGTTTYYNWAVSSMMKRVEKRLAEVVEEAEECYKDAGLDFSVSSDSDQNTASVHSEGGTLNGSASVSVFMTATEETRTVVSNFSSTTYESFDEHEDSSASDTDTDTDGSSLHTPAPSSPILGGTGAVGYLGVKQGELEVVDMMLQSTTITAHDQMPTSVPQESPPEDPPAYTVSPAHPGQEAVPIFPSYTAQAPIPNPVNSVLEALFTTYNAFVQLHVHLSSLLAMSKEREREALDEARGREEILEVRCRRRAWLGRGWGLNNPTVTTKGMGSVSPPPASWKVSNRGNGNGLAMPFKPSGLGRHSWTAEEWEYDPWYCFPEYCPDPHGHRHQRYHSFSRSMDNYYDDLEDDDSASTTSSFAGYGYQYQQSGVPYEESSHSSTSYSPHARFRRSLDESSLTLYDEMYPETLNTTRSLSPIEDGYLPNPYGPDLYELAVTQTDGLEVGGPTAMEVEMRLGMDDMVDIALENSANALTGEDGSLLMECYPNPFEGEGEEASGITEQFFEFSQPIPRRHTEPEVEMERDPDLEPQQLMPRRRSAPALGRPHKKGSKLSRSRKVSAGNINDMKLFFPVTEEEDSEGVVAHQEDVDVSIKFDVYAISPADALDKSSKPPVPPRARTRKDSMKPLKPLATSELGLDIPRGVEVSPPSSPTSPRSPSPHLSTSSTSSRHSPRSPTSPVHVSSSPPSPTSSTPSATSDHPDFTPVTNQNHCKPVGMNTTTSIPGIGPGSETSAQVVGIAI